WARTWWRSRRPATATTSPRSWRRNCCSRSPRCSPCAGGLTVRNGESALRAFGSMSPSQPVVTVLAGARGPRPPGLEPVARLATIRYARSARSLARALAETEVLLIWDFRSARLRDVWSQARRLRWIHVASAGVDAVLFPELASSGVVLTNARGVFDQAIAEYVLGLVLAFAKGFWATFDLQRRRAWRHREPEHVRGQTALIVGPGAIVDEAALLGALRSKRIAGAALDVFSVEPLPRRHPLWRLPGVLVSPHMSGDFVGWAPALSALFVENYLRWRRGEPLLNV